MLAAFCFSNQNGQDIFQKDLPRVRQGNAMMIALEEIHSNNLLQLADLLA